MFINIKYPLRLDNDEELRTLICAVIVFSAFYKITSFNAQVGFCRANMFARNKTMLNGSLWQCTIPYEECRCSAITNKFNHTIHCIAQIERFSLLIYHQ